MRPARTLSISLAVLTLAACASRQPVEEEPADPTDEAGATVDDEAATTAAGATAVEAETPDSGEGPMTFQGLSIETDEPAATKATDAPAGGEAACPDGRAPLAVKLLVLLRHPTDAVPALPADGFALTVDGEPAARGVRVGQVHTLCVSPGEHEVAAHGGPAVRTVRARAPGLAHLPVAGGGTGPVPGLPPGQKLPLPEGTR